MIGDGIATETCKACGGDGLLKITVRSQVVFVRRWRDKSDECTTCRGRGWNLLKVLKLQPPETE